MKKTPEEMALEKYPVKMVSDHYPKEYDENALERAIWLEGYTSNTELEEFKKRLVEKVEKLMERHWAEDDIERGKQLAYEKILFLIAQEDQPEVKKEEKI